MAQNPWDALKEQKAPIDLSKVDWQKAIVEPPLTPPEEATDGR